MSERMITPRASFHQLPVNPEWALASRVLQFDTYNNDPYKREKSPGRLPEPTRHMFDKADLEAALDAIQEAQTIGAAKRAVWRSYYKGALGTSYQGDIQKAVSARKNAIREQRR